MFSDEGSIKLLETRPVPYSEKNPHGVYAVTFDREYAIQKMAYEIEECSQVPFLDLVELMAEAYAIVNPDAQIVGIMAELKSAVNEVISLDPLSLSGSW
jgi:hypothetical protein